MLPSFPPIYSRPFFFFYHKSRNILPITYSIILSQMSCSLLFHGYISFKAQLLPKLTLGLPLAKISLALCHLR